MPLESTRRGLGSMIASEIPGKQPTPTYPETLKVYMPSVRAIVTH